MMKARKGFVLLIALALLIGLLPAYTTSAADLSTRYTLSNGYFYISGVNGMIDELKVDPAGGGSYSATDIIAGNMYMGANRNTAGNGSSGTWTITGNSLTMTGIPFPGANLVGNWTITLSGNQMENSYRITSTANGNKVHSVGYYMDTPFDRDGYSFSDWTKILFDRFVDSSGKYINTRSYKRLNDDISLNLGGSWIYLYGTNNYDLKITPSTGFMRPMNLSSSVMSLAFTNDESNGIPYILNNGQYLDRTMTVQALPHSTSNVHAWYPKFFSNDSAFDSSINELTYERAFGWPPGGTSSAWKEWMGLQRAFLNSGFRDAEAHELSNIQQDPDGYIWAWYGLPPWPAADQSHDHRHRISSPANFINGAYRYVMATGDKAFLKQNMTRLRSAMTYMQSFYNTTSKLFIDTHVDHRGRSGDSGGSYWDILPFGYKDGYANINAYLALNAMAEIEELVGNTTASSNLTAQASDLYSGYNATFWSTDHYVNNIDDLGTIRDYWGTWQNFEASFAGLADATKSGTMIDAFTSKVTGSGSADAFSKWVISARTMLVPNPANTSGGWWVHGYTPPADYNAQLQNGGTSFYTAFYELMTRIKGKGANDAYARLQQILARFNKADHLSGGNPLIDGEHNQHGAEGAVGIWGEFPEAGLVPYFTLYGMIGAKMDVDGLKITPNLPTALTSLGVENFYYWDMNLKITTTPTSVRIQALTNNSPYSWTVNGTPVSGTFDITKTITAGQTVTLARTGTTTFDLSMVPDPTGKLRIAAEGTFSGHVNPNADMTIATQGMFKSASGLNVLAVQSSNSDGSAGLIADFTLPNGTVIATDSSWKVSTEKPLTNWQNASFDDTAWANAKDYGTNGTAPYPTISRLDSTNAHWIWSGQNRSSYERVTPASISASSSLPGWPASNGADNSWSTAWASNWNATANGTETFSVDMGAAKLLRGVRLVPRTSSLYFPIDWRLETSTDGTNWSIAPGHRYANYPTPTGEVQLYFDSGINARYVRVVATKMPNSEGGQYAFHLTEMIPLVWNAPPTKIAIASDAIPGWEASRILDNNLNTVWSSFDSTSASTAKYVGINLGRTETITGVTVQPRPGGTGFPVGFKFQSSADGTNWSDIAGQTHTGYPNPGTDAKTFYFAAPVSAQYIRMLSTEMSPQGPNYYFQLGDMNIIGKTAYLRKLYYDSWTEIARTGGSSSTNASGFTAAGAHDNNSSTIWSSAGYGDSMHTEWVSIDLGSNKSVKQVRVLPRSGGTSFPINFQLEYSTNGTSWSLIPGQSYTDYGNPGSREQLFAFANAVTARYIRIVGTKLSPDSFSNYYMQIAELRADQ